MIIFSYNNQVIQEMSDYQRNAYCDERAQAREEEREENEMEMWYEQQDKEQNEMQEHWAKCYYEEITTTMQEEFSKKIQEALEYTAETGQFHDGTRVLDSDDDIIFIKKCLVNVENFDIDFNGPEIEYFNVIMSGSDIISMNDIATTTNMMEFMDKYFENLDEECYTFIKEVSLRNDASYNKQIGSNYIMIRYIPKWKLTAEKDEDKRLWKQQCDREDEIDRLWFIEDVKEEEERILRENINISEKDRLWFIQFNEDIKKYRTI